METNDEIPKGAIFEEIVRRLGDPATYEPGGMKMMPGIEDVIGSMQIRKVRGATTNQALIKPRVFLLTVPNRLRPKTYFASIGSLDHKSLSQTSATLGTIRSYLRRLFTMTVP